jgi:hypothetical protein
MGGPGRRRLIRWILILACTASVGRFLAVLPLTYPPRTEVDFPAYHEGGRLLIAGEIDRLYSEDFKEFQNLPVVTVLLAPLGALEYERAWRVLWWTNLASILATVGVLLASVRRFFPPLDADGVLLAVALYFWFAPIMHRSLVLGQTTPIMVLLLAGFHALARRGRRNLSAGVLGSICLVKIPPLALLGVFLARRRVRLVAGTLVVVALGLAISLAAFGLDLNLQYGRRVIWTNAGKALAAFNNQSLLGSMLRLLTDRGLTDWRLLSPPLAVTVLHRSAVLVVLGLLLWRGRRLVWPESIPEGGDDRTLEVEIGLGVSLMLLVFPIAWIHYFQFLVVPVTLLPFWWRKEGLPPRGPTVAILAIGILLAADGAVREGAFYTHFENETWFRFLQCSRTLGALLLAWGYARALVSLPDSDG